MNVALTQAAADLAAALGEGFLVTHDGGALQVYCPSRDAQGLLDRLLPLRVAGFPALILRGRVREVVRGPLAI